MENMTKFNKKLHMMDAGTALFRIEGGTGSALGQVKAEMASFGKVYTKNEFVPEELPDAASESDLVLDMSDAFVSCHICCKVENTGDNGYAAVFMEGNAPTKLSGICLLALVAAAIIFIACGMLRGLGMIAVLMALPILVYIYLLPSRKAVRTAAGIIGVLSKEK